MKCITEYRRNSGSRAGSHTNYKTCSLLVSYRPNCQFNVWFSKSSDS